MDSLIFSNQSAFANDLEYQKYEEKQQKRRELIEQVCRVRANVDLDCILGESESEPVGRAREYDLLQ